MRIVFLYLLIIVVVISCRHTNDDISGSDQMAGKIYLVNPYDSSPPQLQASQTVLLQKTKDTSSATFMFSVATSATGEFLFNYLYIDTLYKLHAERIYNTRWDNNILFAVDSIRKPGKNLELTMMPDTVKQNGLFILCLDTVTVTTAGIIPRDSIYIYTSSVLAIEDSVPISGNGASYTVVGNMDGKALKMNLPFDRPLYINSACTYGGKRYTSKFSRINLKKKGIDTLRIRLKS